MRDLIFSLLPVCNSIVRAGMVSLLVGGLLRPGVAQTVVHGQALDTTQAPLPGVSVYLTVGRGSAGITYTSTDTDGRYTLTCPAGLSDTVFLQARLLGFAPYRVALQQSALPRQELRFQLRSAPLGLGEVVVRAPPPPIRYNDTTTYQARDFRSPEQRTLQDLIRQVPGFEVTESGNIRYQGREIGGIYVEGDNLTGADYRRLSRTLDAGMVEKIQPVQRFVENPLLGGLVHSETTVLNITLPADRKKPFFGSLDAGAAFPRYRYASLNAFSYRGRHKFFGLASHNNVGQTKDPSDQLPLVTRNENPLQQELLPPPQLFTPTPLVSSGFRPELANLNQETTAGLVHVVRSARVNGWKLLTDVAGNTDRRHQQFRSATTLQLPDELTLSFREQTRFLQRYQWLRIRQNWFQPIGQRSNLTYEHRFRLGTLHSHDAIDLATVSSTSSTQESLRQQLTTRPWQLAQNALFTTRFSEQVALQTQVAHFLEVVPQRLQLQTTRPERLAELAAQPGVATSELSQAVPARQQGWLWQTSYFRTGRRLNIVPSIELSGSTTSLTSNLLLGQELLRDPTSISRWLATGRVRFHRPLGPAILTGFGGLQRGQLQAQRARGASSRTFTSPTVSLNLQLPWGANTTVGATYRLEQQLPPLQSLVTTPLVPDYRTRQLGLERLLIWPENRVGIQLRHLNPQRLTELDLSLTTTWQSATIGTVQNAGLLTTQVQLVPGPGTRSATISLRGGKFLDTLAVRVQLESSLIYQELIAQRATEPLRRNQLSAFRNRLQLGSAFTGILNGFVGATLQHFVLNRPPERPSRNTQLLLDAQVKLQTRRVTATLRADQLRLLQNSFTILGAEARYTPRENSTWALSLILQNLLNTRTFEQVSITPLLYTNSQYLLLPRLIMPGITYRF